jgi:nitronate monooxygenase
MWRQNRLTDLLNIDTPIILGPFGSRMSSEDLVAIISEAGGLGIFGANGFSAEEIGQIAGRLKGKTAKPFGFNLWVPTADQPLYTAPGFERARARLAPYFEELGLELPERPSQFAPIFEEQIEAVLEAEPALFTFVFGVPSPEILAKFRRRGIATAGTATTVDEAQILAEAGVDIVVATGFEAGGHRVSFLKPAEESLIGSIALIPQVVDRVKLPIIAAGGIGDGRGIAASMILGAEAVQIGTAFLACEESSVSAEYRTKLFSDEARQTQLTRAFTGRLARAIPNRLLAEMANAAGDIAPYPVQSWLTGQMRAAERARGGTDLLSVWSGQAAPLMRQRSALACFNDLVDGASALLGG